MKKISIGLILIFVFFLITVYLLIPGRSSISATTTIKAASPGVFRALSQTDNWKKFWPGDTPFKLEDETYLIKESSYNVLRVDIGNASDTIISTINILPIKPDSLTIQWTAAQENSMNPFRRVAQYRKALALEKNLEKIIAQVQEFMEVPKNIYGIDIKNTIVTDSVLVTTRRQFDHQPSLGDIDGMIQSLKKYIAEYKAVEKNYPMLNIPSPGSSPNLVMTAIAVDRELPATKEFVPKFLLKGGNILETEVKGGPYTIENAFRELENYRLDLKYGSPAIPYQLLVTDRMKETDTSMWITKLYYPVF